MRRLIFFACLLTWPLVSPAAEPSASMPSQPSPSALRIVAPVDGATIHGAQLDIRLSFDPRASPRGVAKVCVQVESTSPMQPRVAEQSCGDVDVDTTGAEQYFDLVFDLADPGPYTIKAQTADAASQALGVPATPTSVHFARFAVVGRPNRLSRPDDDDHGTRGQKPWRGLEANVLGLATGRTVHVRLGGDDVVPHVSRELLRENRFGLPEMSDQERLQAEHELTDMLLHLWPSRATVKEEPWIVNLTPRLPQRHLDNARIMSDRHAMLDALDALLVKQQEKQQPHCFATPSSSLPEACGGPVVMEVGVYKAEFSLFLLHRLRPRKLHLVDIMRRPEIDVNVGAELRSGRAEFHLGRSVDILSAGPGARFADESVDLVYIDAAHTYREVQEDLESALRIVKPGGLIVCNDYIYYDHAQKLRYGVVDAVHQFCVRHSWEIIILALEGAGFYDVALRAMYQPTGPDLRRIVNM